eukprot:IDg8549t1
MFVFLEMSLWPQYGARIPPLLLKQAPNMPVVDIEPSEDANVAS